MQKLIPYTFFNTHYHLRYNVIKFHENMIFVIKNDSRIIDTIKSSAIK